MLEKDMLKCTNCGATLRLAIGYDGADWNSVKGDKSGFAYEVDLCCSKCGRLYPIGRLKREYDFCENVEKFRPYLSQDQGTTE